MTCTQREFAAIAGISVGYVNRLAKMGVVATNPVGNVLVLASYRQYVQGYFPPWRQHELIEAASIAAESLLQKRYRRGDALGEVRRLDSAARAAELVAMHLELVLRFYDGRPAELIRLHDRVSRRANRLRERQRTAAESLSQQLSILPAKIRTVMKARYVDCLQFDEIPDEIGASVRTVYRYHRRGVDLLAAAQD